MFFNFFEKANLFLLQDPEQFDKDSSIRYAQNLLEANFLCSYKKTRNFKILNNFNI
jgi:hypothetical protein